VLAVMTSGDKWEKPFIIIINRPVHEDVDGWPET